MNNELYVTGTPFRTSSPGNRVPFYFSVFFMEGTAWVYRRLAGLWQGELA